MNPIGPSAVPQEWIGRLASLVATIRPDWQEPGIRAALHKVADRPLVDVAQAALAACLRVDQRTPDVISRDGPHWPSGRQAQRTYTEPGIVTRCDHGLIGARCDTCNPKTRQGVPCPPNLRATMREAIHEAQDVTAR